MEGKALPGTSTAAVAPASSTATSKDMHLARTAVQESAKIKRLEPHFRIFGDEARREGGHGKLLLVCHAHGSAPRSPYLPCQVSHQRIVTELEQNYGLFQRKKTEGEVANPCGFHCTIGPKHFLAVGNECNTGAELMREETRAKKIACRPAPAVACSL